jgi:DNA invertase Pin-like site-specific DNA recombinase
VGEGHGYALVAVFADEGISGSNGLDSRVALADALDAVRQGAAMEVVVYRLDPSHEI